MGTSVFFDFYTDESEQNLLTDLVQESVHVMGTDMYYVPRTVVDRDALYTEAEYHTYDDAYSLEFFVKTIDQMGGEGALLSKFGVQLRDEMILTVSKRTFQEEVLDKDPSILRPREGDLVYVPFYGALFVIKFVDKKAFFYQLGDLQAYDLTIELYEGSSAEFNTGVAVIDQNYVKITDDLQVMEIRTEAGDALKDERDGWQIVAVRYDDPVDVSQNVAVEDEAEEVIDWSEADPFSTGGKY
jgi:neck protein